MNALIRSATAQDWSRIAALLIEAGLPTEDLGPQSIGNFTVATEAGEVVGAIAVERYGNHGLLRSLAVDPAWRGAGIGRALVEAVESSSASHLAELTLLTQTAAVFFRDLGFRDIERVEAPADLRASAEFTHLCPSSSACLTKALRPVR